MFICSGRVGAVVSAITVSGLTKTYGAVRANEDVSFEVHEGEVFGYLGPNGAGKSTTIRTLLGFQSPTAGTATVLGADVRDESAHVDARRRIGYVPANPAFDPTATGREVLALHGAVQGDERSEELLERFPVPLDRPVRSYSTGQRQKLAVVRGFAHDPELLLLDEPTAGLDPLMQRRFETLVAEERDAGKAVLVSSHVLGEVRRLCDRVGVVRDGRLVVVERVETLLDRSGKTVRLLAVGDHDPDQFRLAGVHDLTVEPAATTPSGETDGPVTRAQFTFTGDVNDLLARLSALQLRELDIEEAPLERVFAGFYDESDDGVASTDGVSTMSGDAPGHHDPSTAEGEQ